MKFPHPAVRHTYKASKKQFSRVWNILQALKANEVAGAEHTANAETNGTRGAESRQASKQTGQEAQNPGTLRKKDAGADLNRQQKTEQAGQERS